MDRNNVEIESNSSCYGEKNDHDQQSERIKKLEDNYSLMCNYVKSNNHRIHSLISKIMRDSELLSGLQIEDDLPGTDGSVTVFDSVAKDSNFSAKVTAKKQVDDKFKKLESSLKDLRQEIKEKGEQLESMREELNTISRTTCQHQLPASNRELGDFIDNTGVKSEPKRFCRNRSTDHEENFESFRERFDDETIEDELNDITDAQSKSRKFSKKHLTWNRVDKLNNITDKRSESSKLSKKSLTRNSGEMDELSDTTGAKSEVLNRDIESSRKLDLFDYDLTKRTKFLMHNKEELEHHHLHMDTYSYLAVSDYFVGYVPTYAFCMATFVLSIQVVTLVIFAADVTNLYDRDNPLSIPAGVGAQVRASQFVALVISCWNQGEISDSFNVFSLRFDADKARDIGAHANRVKWYFSAVMRIVIGILNLMVTFTLVVNSETVKEVMLDFAAVTFVSELDHANFRLSLWGYMGKTVQQLAVKIKTTSIFVGKPTARLLKIPRLAWMFILLCALMLPWAIITAKQERGIFMDRTIFVQFDDGFSPSLGAFSGLYEIDLDNTLDGIRVNYLEIQNKSAIFKYCTAKHSWIFRYGPTPEKHHPDNVDDHGCWLRAISSQTENLDIARTSQDTWFVIDNSTRLEMPLQHMYVSGRSNYYGKYCESGSGCGEEGMHCEEDIRKCVCNDGLFGLNCEFPEPCQTLEIDTRNSGFNGTRSWSRKYSVVQEDGKKRPLQVYGKPVYLGGDMTRGLFDVMIFTGRRWILTDSESFDDYNQSATIMANNDTARNFVEFLESDFHAYWSDYTFYFASEPVDVGTPTDSATPVGLQWYRMETTSTHGVSLRSRGRIWQSMGRIEANLFCAVCNDETNPCFFNATCGSEGSCNCNTGSSGSLCQIPPSGNGLCDNYFNTPEFNWDGGDCCEETCTSTEENTCGYESIENPAGISSNSFIGYLKCQNPRYRSRLYGSVTLYDVIERGTVRCGSEQFPGFLNITDGVYTGFEADLCRAIAAAALGEPEAIDIIETNGDNRFSDLSEGKFDVLLGRTTFTAGRDIFQRESRSGFSFVPTPYFFDGVRYGGIPPFSRCADNEDLLSPECSNLTICVDENASWLQVTERLSPDRVIRRVKSIQEEVGALQYNMCNVVAGESTSVAEFVVRRMGFTGPVYEIGNNVFSKEPLSAVTRQDDRVWSKFVSWIFEALIQAEESNVTKSTANKLSTSDIFGEQFQNMFQNAVEASGNYGEIYQKNLESLFHRDGLNRINMGSSGLIYSFPFGTYETNGPDPIVGGTIEAIQRRGALNCGIVSTPGFAVLDYESET